MSSGDPSVFRLVSHMLAAVFNSRSAFHREWQRYTALANRNDSVEGRWAGEWVSEVSGHRGELKCVLVPVASGKYRAFFHAGFSKLFRVGYVTDLQVEQRDGRITLAGQEDLGALAGGIYRCEGEIREAAFNCHYSCQYDQGLFRLKRVD
jgi:hypothetical protein